MASSNDAQVVIELYKLRTEETMRKARNWVVVEWMPTSAEEINTVIGAFGTEKNAYFRQVFSYWDMAVGLVHRGAVDEGLFCDWAGEMFFVYTKMEPFLATVRQVNPMFLANVEKLITSKPEHLQRVQRIKDMLKKVSAASSGK